MTDLLTRGLMMSVLLGIVSSGLAVAETWNNDVVPPEWGPLWQPQLPAKERHPSLLFDENDRQRMRERLNQPPTDAWWKSFRSSGYRCAPALEWWLLGDEAAARRSREDLLTRPIWREAGHGYLEPSSHRFADYVLAYDVLAAWDGLSPEDHRAIRARIAAEAEYYYRVMDGVTGGANYGNQRTLGTSALGMAALALCEYREGSLLPVQWLTRALYQTRREENWWFFRPDGLFVEGLGYSQYMGCLFIPFVISYERATGHYLFEEQRLREWLVFAAYQTTAQGEFIPWGTCESSRGVRFFALLSNQRYGRDLAPLCNWAFDWRAVSPQGFQIPAALALWEQEVPGEMPPASRFFPRSQTVVLRENWGHDSVTAWFAGKDGSWPLAYRYGTYSHGDAGAFVLSAWDEILAGDSGYDHWKSRDYYAAEFHNVLLIDGKGPEQATVGEMSAVETEGLVRHATVTSAYQNCTVRRTLALIRGRYVVVVDRVDAQAEHDYAWQVRSNCPPGSEGTSLKGREVTWPGLDALQWRDLKLGRTQLTTVVPSFTALSLDTGRWRPISSRDEFHNQVATARWRAASTTAMFVLLPNLRDQAEVSWRALPEEGIEVAGPGWKDRLSLLKDELVLQSESGDLDRRLAL
jgi:hypothetical protein